MKPKDIPAFNRFDLLELYFINQPYGKGSESELAYALEIKRLRGEGTVLEVCKKVAGEFAIEPEKYLLRNLEKIIVYSRK
jgi:hypothetical protein